MIFCSLKDRQGPLGPYAITLSQRARRTLEKQSTRQFLRSRVDWVLDGLHVIIDAMLSDDERRVSDYLLLNYPDSVAQQQTDTRGKRQTMRFRMRYLLRCLETSSAYFPEFSTEDVAPLLTTLEIFTSCVKQAFGEKAAATLESFVTRFDRLWSCDAHSLDSEEAMRDELSRLVDTEQMAFADLYQAVREKEATRARPDANDKVARALEGVKSEIAHATAVQKQSMRAFERAMASAEEDGGDVYSQRAGLNTLHGARREEVLACIRYSHEKPFAVSRGAYSGARSLQALASAVWRENSTCFTSYACLKVEPGYRDERSLAAKLYKLAAKYPSADHFVWSS